MDVINQALDDRFPVLQAGLARAYGVTELAFDHRVHRFGFPTLLQQTIQPGKKCTPDGCASLNHLIGWFGWSSASPRYAIDVGYRWWVVASMRPRWLARWKPHWNRSRPIIRHSIKRAGALWRSQCVCTLRFALATTTLPNSGKPAVFLPDKRNRQTSTSTTIDSQ